MKIKLPLFKVDVLCCWRWLSSHLTPPQIGCWPKERERPGGRWFESREGVEEEGGRGGEKSFINLSRAAFIAPVFLYSCLPPPGALLSSLPSPRERLPPCAHGPPGLSCFQGPPHRPQHPVHCAPLLTQTHTWHIT